MNTKLFRVAARSENTNAFGLRQYYLLAEDGETWVVLRSDYGGTPPWAKYEDVLVPVTGEHSRGWASIGCECPELRCPKDKNLHAAMIAEVFPPHPALKPN